jgi:hypothetical protein
MDRLAKGTFSAATGVADSGKQVWTRYVLARQTPLVEPPYRHGRLLK